MQVREEVQPVEEFEIRIGEEIRDDLPFKQPRLTHRRHRVWGDPKQDDVRIIFGQNAYRQVNQHACSRPKREVGGVLLGEAYRHEGITYVEITETLPAPLTRAGAAHVTFTPDTWAAVNREQAERFPDLRVVGWYHTHPRMDVFLSGDDVFVHRHFFPEPWQVALVVEPHKHYGGFFLWEGDAVRPASGFYERFDVASKSLINWRNLLSPAFSPASVAVRQWVMPAVVAVLAVLVLGLVIQNLQTRSTLNQLQAELTELKATAQVVGGRVDSIDRQIDRATVVARAVAATQTASVQATEQASTAVARTAQTQPAETAAVQATTTAGSVAISDPAPVTPTLGVTHTSTEVPPRGNAPSRVTVTAR